MSNTKLTSVKVLENLYNAFKIKNIKGGMNLQTLTNRAIYLYINDENFRKNIDETADLTISGSNF